MDNEYICSHLKKYCKLFFSKSFENWKCKEKDSMLTFQFTSDKKVIKNKVHKRIALFIIARND